MGKKILVFPLLVLILLLSITTSAQEPECGNGVCEENLGENSASCSIDCPLPNCSEGQITSICVCGQEKHEYGYCCSGQWRSDGCGPVCGDGMCEEGEDCSSCPNDCGDCEPFCGDGMCNGNESCEDCQQDCGTCATVCGNGICEQGEENTCHDDCMQTCAEKGGHYCPTEYTCQYKFYVSDTENCCQEECGSGGGDACGNGMCEEGEKETCPGDCHICGNGMCEGGEDKYSCPDDCGGGLPYCYNGPIHSEGCVCGGMAEYYGYCCDGRHEDNPCVIVECGNWICEPGGGENIENCPSDCGGANCGDGLCEKGKGENEYNCSADCIINCGDGYCAKEKGEDEMRCPQDCHEYEKPVCGDHFCDFGRGEDSYNCPDDCSQQTRCGDGICQYPETEHSCHDDCRPVAKCGDGMCEYYFGENESTCPEDCGREAVCGNGKCEHMETPENCHDDCRKGECGDGYCDFGEDPNNCPSDCGIVMPRHPEMQCPSEESIKKVLAMCEQYGLRQSMHAAPDGCVYAECMPSGYGPGPDPWRGEPDCEKIFDPGTGMERMECGPIGGECPQEPPEIKQRCEDSGGNPRPDKDPWGCEITICEYGTGGYSTGPRFFGGGECPPEEEIDRKARECEKYGMETFIEVEFDGCKYVRCEGMGERREFECPFPPFDEMERMKEKCFAEGGRIVEFFGEGGCPEPRCVAPGEECMDVPEEAFRRCSEAGGELIVKKDEQGCVHFSDCVGLGNERFEYDRIDRMPDTSELIEMGFKLEELKIALEKLKNRASEIAEYYEGEGSSEDAERMRQVSEMFDRINEKVDHAREMIVEISDHPDREGLMEIKHEIKYIKEVMLKDVLYLMLGSKKRAEERDEAEGGDCGEDESCFMKALRVCAEAKISHSERDGKEFIGKIIGLEEDKCHYRIELDLEGKSLSMDCYEPEYQYGELGEHRFIKICEGSLMEFMMEEGKMRPKEPYDDYDRDMERGYNPYGPREPYGPYEEPYKPYGPDYDSGGGYEPYGEPYIPPEVEEKCKIIRDEDGKEYKACPIDTKEEIAQANPLTGFVTGVRLWR